MFWGTLSDRWGRRPMFIGCMVTLSLSCVGLALVPTHAYAGLMLLRCLQAFGSASTVALGACPLSGSVSSSSAPESEGEICFESRADATRSFALAGAGVIADIAAPFERGSFFGLWNIGPMIGPSLGPVLGGALSDRLGWRYVLLSVEDNMSRCVVISARPLF